MDAIKWTGVFWKLYWWVFIPFGALAGTLSVWIALRGGRRGVPENE
jgi:hypothetical protein